MNNNPLVSIIIATYNSSRFVLETLDSAISQTYPNIEIIVTDDCSTDNTVKVCRQWMDEHRHHGKPLILVETLQNTGVSGNANRGFNASHGEWIKFIAGDDILAPSAIDAYIKFVQSRPEIKHLRANAVHFSGDFKDADLTKHDVISQYIYREGITAKDQFRVISKIFFGSGPTYFINANAFRSVGCFDERFQMQEDYPLFIKMIGKGHKMEYLDHVTVYKRIVPTSLQYDRNANDIFPKNKVRVIMDWGYQYKKEVLPPLWRLFLNYSLFLQKCIVKSGNSTNSFFCRFIYAIYMITDPFIWYGHFYSVKCKLYQKKQFRAHEKLISA